MNEIIQEHTGVLVVMRCWCGIQHAVPNSMRNEQIRQHNGPGTTMSIFCPLGHKHFPSGVSPADPRDTEASRRSQKAAKGENDEQ